MNLLDLSFDSHWTLFLDRDGVINRRIVGDYVKVWKDFHFLEGSLEAIQRLSGVFGRIFVVSNQQGVGKGLMGIGQVEEIHERMLQQVNEAGGRIDKVYFSPHLEEHHHPNRKPGAGMALKAQEEYPEILFEKSVVAGDSISDMQFGRNIGAVNILILPKNQLMKKIPKGLYDFHFTSLHAFSMKLTDLHQL
jgi:histidinol-phosphate phosphatase family protein